MKKITCNREIYVLNVLPEFQRKGVGKALMRQTLNSLKGQTIYLQVASLNRQALHFYEQSGFLETGVQTEREMWGVHFLQAVYQRT